jgi:8-oxo-dGTP diphosphatase
MDRPTVGISLLIRREPNLILLGKRIGAHANGYLGTPGGHLEMFESFASAAVRELREECGDNLLIDKIPHYFYTTNNCYYSENRHYITIFMTTNWISGEPELTEPHKFAYWGWYRWNLLDTPSCGCPVMPGIQQLYDQNINPFDEDDWRKFIGETK